MVSRALPLVLALTAATAGSLSAQCIGGDNLDTAPCCAPVIANLPIFPSITLPGLGICWDSCNPNGQACTQVTLAPPVQTGCAQYDVNLDVKDCSGNPLLKSVLKLDYTRTWDEIPLPGQQYQVWRFVVKADVAPATTAGPPCQVPSCLSFHPTAFYYGYLDYAYECGVGWNASLALYHGCDKFQHDPLFSSRPGAFHPTRSFALVAPHTTANPFIPVLLPAPGGPAFAEGIRQSTNPATLGCTAEEPILGGILQPIGAACACPFSFFPPQTTARHIDVTGACGSSARTINAFPTVPWYENMTISLGSWTTFASYPGPEAVWVDEGTYLHVDACDPTGLGQAYAEIKYGATTEGGYQAIQATGLVLDRFTDLANNYSVALGNPILPPFVGSVKATRDLVYTNVP